jgi:hypothetical protein
MRTVLEDVSDRSVSRRSFLRVRDGRLAVCWSRLCRPASARTSGNQGRHHASRQELSFTSCPMAGS